MTQYCLRFPFKLSRDITEITPLWETPSLQPFLKTYWLTPVNDWPIVAKHANMTSSRGSINAAPATIRQNLFLHLAEPRLWLKMLQLTVKVRSFEGRPHGCSSAAFRWVWHFLKVVRLPSDQRWDLRDSGDELMQTKGPHSSHRRTCRTGHQPGFSRPPSMAVRRAEGRCGSKGISRRRRCCTEEPTV